MFGASQKVFAICHLSNSFCLGLPSAEQRNKNMALIATAIITLAFITAYPAYAINHYISSNANPTVEFVLGTVYRNVPYANSQTMDIYITNAADSDLLRSQYTFMAEDLPRATNPTSKHLCLTLLLRQDSWWQALTIG